MTFAGAARGRRAKEGFRKAKKILEDDYKKSMFYDLLKLFDHVKTK